MASDGSEQHSVTLLDAVKARRFLKQLVNRPFVALIPRGEGDNTVVVYCKGMSEDDAERMIRSYLDHVE